mgnify:CR=1 FL=1
MTASTGAPADWRNRRYPKGRPVANRWPDLMPVERILSRVVVTDNGCLEFTGSRGFGYGRIKIDGVVHGAHRVMYTAFVGPIPGGLQIDHLCRNRACVNPAHLEAVTSSENKRRGSSPAAINARKTRCNHGHLYTPENTYVTKLGSRACRTCIRERHARKTS